MSRELEERLQAVPERWRDATRTRAYAVMDYVAAGDDGSLLVDVLCRRTDLTRSAFYSLVRRWHKSGQDPAALAPWARRADAKPRIARETTAHIDAQIAPLIDDDPQRPTEPIALKVLSDWPGHLDKPGISYVRRRVGHLRAAHQKKTRRVRRPAGDDAAEGSDLRPQPRWPLDVILVDHIALEAVVWDGDEPTLPIITLAVDLASWEPVAVSIGIDGPGPGSVVAVIADLAAEALRREAPGPPTIVLSTTFARGWPELTAELRETGAVVIAQRSRSLRFGPEVNRLLEGSLDGYKLAPRLGHRPVDERATPRAVLTMPNRELPELEQQLRRHVRKRLEQVANDLSWPPAAAPEPGVWNRMAALSNDHPVRRDERPENLH